MTAIAIRFPDPEYEAAFIAYRNYFEDLAGHVGGAFGLRESLAGGVHESVLGLEPVHNVNRRHLDENTRDALGRALRKSWGSLRRADREIESFEAFDEEANAWLPVMAYYALYHGIVALAIASNHEVPHDHAAALKLGGRSVARGLLPYPWSASCRGCPQIGDESYNGFDGDPETVHVFARPDPESTQDRLAMFLRTTRKKELERLFGRERRRGVQPGHERRNLSRGQKAQIAARTAPTTLFDVFWRLRKKASYDDADTFVLGAADEQDAWRLAQSLVIVADATVAALEAVIAAYVGPREVKDLVSAYRQRCNAQTGSAVHRHAAAWDSRVGPF